MLRQESNPQTGLSQRPTKRPTKATSGPIEDLARDWIELRKREPVNDEEASPVRFSRTRIEH